MEKLGPTAKIGIGREGSAMSTTPVSVPKIWNRLNTENQQHALTYMEFLYDQQEENKKKPKKLPFGCLKGKLTMTEDFDDPLPEFEEYR